MNPIRSIPLFFFTILYTSLFAQSGGAIKGKVIDGELNTELPGATIRVQGTSIGTTSDIYGDYYLSLKKGSYTLEVRFLGFANQTHEITIENGKIVNKNFSLEADAEFMDEVVVTSQQIGQQAAINRQIQANSIVNVVSKDKIESLPDQNAAESVGRLSGVAIQRNGGEGQKIAIRGLSPRFNSITINGERLPSSDANDRSFDLST
ncbi:MAG: carboxypeptidase-like regulatory domain-containing protein [Bacteroidota bacterium]